MKQLFFLFLFKRYLYIIWNVMFTCTNLNNGKLGLFSLIKYIKLSYNVILGSSWFLTKSLTILECYIVKQVQFSVTHFISTFRHIFLTNIFVKCTIIAHVDHWKVFYTNLILMNSPTTYRSSWLCHSISKSQLEFPKLF